MAEFFGAAEAYGNGGAAGLAAWERGQLGREIGHLEAEIGPNGFRAQAARLVAAAKSDGDGYRSPKITIGTIEVSSQRREATARHPR